MWRNRSGPGGLRTVHRLGGMWRLARGASLASPITGIMGFAAACQGKRVLRAANGFCGDLPGQMGFGGGTCQGKKGAAKAPEPNPEDEAAELERLRQEGFISGGGKAKPKPEVPHGTKRLRRVITYVTPDGEKATRLSVCYLCVCLSVRPSVSPSVCLPAGLPACLSPHEQELHCNTSCKASFVGECGVTRQSSVTHARTSFDAGN
jgi:hypothetical protein